MHLQSRIPVDLSTEDARKLAEYFLQKGEGKLLESESAWKVGSDFLREGRKIEADGKPERVVKVGMRLDSVVEPRSSLTVAQRAERTAEQKSRNAHEMTEEAVVADAQRSRRLERHTALKKLLQEAGDPGSSNRSGSGPSGTNTTNTTPSSAETAEEPPVTRFLFQKPVHETQSDHHAQELVGFIPSYANKMYANNISFNGDAGLKLQFEPVMIVNHSWDRTPLLPETVLYGTKDESKLQEVSASLKFKWETFLRKSEGKRKKRA